tara:strand:- start:916 stop:1356 length:441 start_codon:yes stop_codon:yes gene_type:complete
MLPSATRRGGVSASPAEIIAAAVFLRIVGEDEVAGSDPAADIARRRRIIDRAFGSQIERRTKAGPGRPRLDDDEIDAEWRHFLRNRLDKPFDSPFGRVIKAEIGMGDLPAFGRHLHNATTALRPQIARLFGRFRKGGWCRLQDSNL